MDELVIVTPMGLEGRAVRRHLSRAGNVVSGMGAIRAANAGRAIADNGPVAMAVAGFAGGLRAGQRPGQVVVASELSTSDDDASSVALPSAPAVADQLSRAGFDVIVGPVVSTTKLAWGDRRRQLAATGAVAADMESAWLAGPLLAIAPHRVAVVRVLSDAPDHELIRPTMGRSLRTAYRTLRAVAPVVETWAAAVAPRTAVLASPRSFCAGVERAITVVRRALEQYGPPVYVRRQIIHNTHVVAELTAAGAVFVAELDEVPRGALTVLAAHGVAPAVREQAAARDLLLIDATCPLVAKVHNEARARVRDGYSIVLIGHDDHEEIVGTQGEAPQHIQVISSVDEVDALEVPDPDRVAYLTQTTLALDETAAVVAALAERFPTIVGPRADDICYASQNRQESVRAVAAESDLVLVVGSPNSSNSNRLVEVARREGVTAHLVEDETEIDLSWLAAARTVGITAGASAPDHLVHRVVDRLACLGATTVVERNGHHEDVHFPLPAEVR